MNFRKNTGDWKEAVAPETHLAQGAGSVPEPELDQALRRFRSSVHAWSEAAYAQRRQPVAARSLPMVWRRAAAWSMASILAVGVAGGGVFGYQYRQEQARMAAARQAEQQRQLAEQRAREVDQELAKVDSDVSREVPDALEPLAQLMNEDEGQ